MRRPGGFDAPPARPIRQRAVRPSKPVTSARAEPQTYPTEAATAGAATRQSSERDVVRRAAVQARRARRARRSQQRSERRRFTEHLRQRRRWVLLGCAAVLGLACFVAVGVLTPVMAVRDIQVLGAHTTNSDELGRALTRFTGKPLALVSDREVHRVLESFPRIGKYQVERIPPHTLVIRVEERGVVVAVQHDQTYDLLDPSGVLLEQVTQLPPGVPLAQLDVSNDRAFRAVTSVVRDLPQDLKEQLVSVRASTAQDVTFELVLGTEVLWGDATQTQRKAATLRAMLAAVGAVEMIDVSVPETPVFR